MKQAEDVVHGNRRSLIWIIVIGGALLLVASIASIMLGSTRFSWQVLWSMVINYTPNREQLIIATVRLPRLITTILIGANLAVAGAIMQAITRNPLASPSVFSINAGASFVVVVTLLLFPSFPSMLRVASALIGAFVTVMTVYGLSLLIRWGKTEVKMALIGVTMQAFFSVVIQLLLLLNERKTELVMFWLTGSVVGNRWNDMQWLIPFSLAGLILAVYMSRAASILSLGSDIAKGLGQRVKRLRVVLMLLVVVLAGISVSVAGPISFIGLIVPHMVRALVGVDYRVIIPVSALLGAVLLTVADVASRFIHFPAETPVGIVTALLGAPFFIYLARKKVVTL